jgi:hypothetical protein
LNRLGWGRAKGAPCLIDSIYTPPEKVEAKTVKSQMLRGARA